MADETERPEDTIRRFAGEIQQLQAWKAKYAPVADLYDAVDLGPNDQVTDLVLFAKVADFEEGGTAIAMTATDGCDWITQLGMVHGGLRVLTQGELHKKGDDSPD